jgi:hypothetical protein
MNNKTMDLQTLGLDNRQSRLNLDYQIAMLMRSPLMEIDAYRNLEDLKLLRNPINSVSESHLAVHYRVLYKLRTLIGRGEYSKETTVRFDLFANNNYPLSEPASYVIDSPMPWSPHFDEDHQICIGDVWIDSGGDMLLGDLVVHIAKLLNFDEPEYKNPRYVGYNGEAVRYWTTVLGRQPLTKNISYPVVEDILRELVKPPVPAAPSPSKRISRKKLTGSLSQTITLKPTSPAADAPRRQIGVRRISIR